jgi:hypothetical protein
MLKPDKLKRGKELLSTLFVRAVPLAKVRRKAILP